MNITSINVSSLYQVTKKGIDLLLQLPKLKILKMDYLHTVSGKVLNRIAKKDLIYLSMNFSLRNVFKELPCLSGLKNLTHLDISGSFHELYIEDIRHKTNPMEWKKHKLNGIPLLHQLTFLNVSCIPAIDVTFMEHITSLTNLYSLNLDDCYNITDGYQFLANLNQLSMLSINDNESLNNTRFSSLSSCENLWCLRMDGINGVNQEGLDQVKNFTKIQVLSLNACSRTDNYFVPISIIDHNQWASNIRTLSLNFSRITDEYLANVSCMPMLEELHISFCSFITDNGIYHLRKCPMLKKLTMNHCINLTQKALNNFWGNNQIKIEFMYYDRKFNEQEYRAFTNVKFVPIIQ